MRGGIIMADEMHYASRGVANAGLATGIIGTALGVMNWGGLGGLFGARDVGYGGYHQSFEGKVASLESEIAMLQAEKYSDNVSKEVYIALDKKISENLEKLYSFVIDLDKRTALNAQGLMYENQITNNKIDCCCDKAAMQTAFNKQLGDLADAAIISYVNSNFINGVLKLPITSICPQPTTTTN